MNKQASKTDDKTADVPVIEKAQALTDKLKQASKTADSQASKSKTDSKTASKTAVKQDHAVKLTINQSAVYQQTACNILFKNAVKIKHDHCHKHLNRLLSMLAVKSDADINKFHKHFNTSKIKLVNDKTVSASKFNTVRLTSSACKQYDACFATITKNVKLVYHRNDAVNQFNTSASTVCLLTLTQLKSMIKRYKA